MLSDERMAEIRQRAAIVGDKVWDVPDGDMNGRILAIGPIEGYDGDALGFREGDPTIEFIAHSPADVHALLAEVATLRERAEAAEQRLATVTPIVEAVAVGLTLEGICPFCHFHFTGLRGKYHADDCQVPQARAWLVSPPAGDGEGA